MDAKPYFTPESLHADRSEPVIVHAEELPWVPSPLPGVDRRFLEREGMEVARATSIVRYAARSAFDAHKHQLGEEFLVLDGTFSDDSGDYGAGTYVRNPPGSAHRPFTEDGCMIFVKLRQMQPSEKNHVVARIDDSLFKGRAVPSISRQDLFSSSQGEIVRVEGMKSGDIWTHREPSGGEEILLLSGELMYGSEKCRSMTWIRTPHGLEQPISAITDCSYWVKRGHLRSK